MNEIVAYLCLGTNLGNRRRNLNEAIELLEKQDIKILKKSNIYETEPVGYTNQPFFLNQVIKVKTTYQPLELLDVIKYIEKKIGRKRTKRNYPRIIDIDILLFNNKKINTKRLTIPHKEIKNRKFVLILLKELNHKLKIDNEPIEKILKRIDDKKIVRKI